MPYVEQDDLYREFHLDEPWDGPHNIALLPRMPGMYAPPSHKRSRMPPYHTVCHVFVGKGAAFERSEGLRYPQDFPDGGTNTFLVVEAGEPVAWRKPEDLLYDRPAHYPSWAACSRTGSGRGWRTAGPAS